MVWDVSTKIGPLGNVLGTLCTGSEGLQQIAFNHSLDIDCKDLLSLCKKFTENHIHFD